MITERVGFKSGCLSSSLYCVAPTDGEGRNGYRCGHGSEDRPVCTQGRTPACLSAKPPLVPCKLDSMCRFS